MVLRRSLPRRSCDNNVYPGASIHFSDEGGGGGGGKSKENLQIFGALRAQSRYYITLR